MEWLTAIERLRAARARGALVTVAAVRGHVPREAGAKMVVGPDTTWGSIGGGNLEQVAIERARALGATPELITVSLSDKAPHQHGVQCCGGEVTILIEPLPPLPAVAVFGLGHVGHELARILSRHELDLYLVDSRADQVERAVAAVTGATARVDARHLPLLPESALADLPPGTHVVIMTHDHAEDLALCDAELRAAHLGSVGLIGSAAKWSRFRKELRANGLADATSRIRCPIGLPGITSKRPAAIAVGVATELLMLTESPATEKPAPARLLRPALP